jgi:hypothetical protein
VWPDLHGIVALEARVEREPVPPLQPTRILHLTRNLLLSACPVRISH